MLEYVNHNGLYKIMEPVNDVITIIHDGKMYNLKVKENDKYIFKCYKKYVAAINGAFGLYKYFEKIIKENFCTGYLNMILYKYTQE